MWSRDFKLGFAAALLALTAMIARADLKVGDTMPGLAPAGVVALGEGKLPVTDGQVVLLDFWASWCDPCKKSFPAMARLHQDYAARGLVIVAVSIDEKPAPAAAFARKLAPPFPALHDRELKLVKQVVVPTMPTSYLIGRDGRVRFIHTGFHGDATDKDVRREIEALLAEKR